MIKVTLLLMGLYSAAAIGADCAVDTELAIRDVPSRVLDAVHAGFPKAAPISAGQRSKGGKVIFYDVEIQDAGTRSDVYLDADGKIVSTAITIPTKRLPKNIVQGIRATFEGWKISEVQEETDYKTHEVTYSVELSNAGRRIEVECNKEAKVVSQEDLGDGK